MSRNGAHDPRQPIDVTPMHPQYPCAHCLISTAVASTIEAVLGTAETLDIVMTSPTASGVTHRWTIFAPTRFRPPAGFLGVLVPAIEPGASAFGPVTPPGWRCCGEPRPVRQGSVRTTGRGAAGWTDQAQRSVAENGWRD